MTREYPVVYEWAGRNFSGYAPDIGGCAATASTLSEIRSKLKGALEAHLQWMSNDGDRIPAPSETVTVDMEQDAKYPRPRSYYVVVEKLSIALPRAKALKRRLRKAKPLTGKRRTLPAA